MEIAAEVVRRVHGSQRWLQSNPRKTPYCLPILQRPADWWWPTRRRTSRDGDAPPGTITLTICTSGNIMLYQFGRSRKRRMETKKFLRLLRQGYGIFAAKICFKPQGVDRKSVV